VSVCFENQSFCFTGALVDLKRSAAQREVRARGGLTVDRVNEHLDYLVVAHSGQVEGPVRAKWQGRFGACGRARSEATLE